MEERNRSEKLKQNWTKRSNCVAKRGAAISERNLIKTFNTFTTSHVSTTHSSTHSLANARRQTAKITKCRSAFVRLFVRSLVRWLSLMASLNPNNDIIWKEEDETITTTYHSLSAFMPIRRHKTQDTHTHTTQNIRAESERESEQKREQQKKKLKEIHRNRTNSPIYLLHSWWLLLLLLLCVAKCMHSTLIRHNRNCLATMSMTTSQNTRILRAAMCHRASDRTHIHTSAVAAHRWSRLKCECICC